MSVGVMKDQSNKRGESREPRRKNVTIKLVSFFSSLLRSWCLGLVCRLSYTLLVLVWVGARSALKLLKQRSLFRPVSLTIPNSGGITFALPYCWLLQIHQLTCAGFVICLFQNHHKQGRKKCGIWSQLVKPSKCGIWSQLVKPSKCYTGPTLLITCRLLSLQYWWPLSWSCPCCLWLVTSMTLVLSTFWFVLNSVRPRDSLSSTDVHTSILKECSLCVFVDNTVRRDLDHNMMDWGINSLLVHWVSLVDNYQVVEDH